MMRMSSIPARTASSTTYWIAGLSTTGSISLGWALVAGRNRVPRPAAGMTAVVTVRGVCTAPVLLRRRWRTPVAVRPGGPGTLALALVECQRGDADADLRVPLQGVLAHFRRLPVVHR